ncbi:MAG: glutamate/gamma-aminobutyrate family transporter YjeM [Sarcina sp.]
MGNTKNKFKISFLSFVSMIFLTVYGLANGQQVFYQMGYASITYLIIGAIFFFIPYGFMVAEMSSAFKDKAGGIFSWMTEAVGERFSIIGTFIWYGSFVVMWFGASAICIQLSVAIFGKDTTANWHIFGLTSPEVLALVGVVYMVIVGLVSTKGMKRMTFLSNISIVTVILAHIVVLGAGVTVFALSGFHFAQGFDFTKLSSYFYGPNPSYVGILPAVGFMVFAIFVYGGMENSAGLVDKVENPKKNVPKAIIVSSIAITVLYIAIVLITGMVCNWKETFGSGAANLQNLTIFITQQEFFRLGGLLGMNAAHSTELGLWVNRIMNILTLIGFTAIPLRIYSPIKHMFEGMPKGMLPDKVLKLNKHGVASNAIVIQTVIVVFFVLLLGFGGGSVSQIFNKMTLMVSVASTVPVSFIVYAYIKFKRNNKIKKEYEFFGAKIGIIVGIVCFLVITFTNIFSIIEPALEGNITNSLWVALGPVMFGVAGLALDLRYRRRLKLGKIKREEVKETEEIEVSC